MEAPLACPRKERRRLKRKLKKRKLKKAKQHAANKIPPPLQPTITPIFIFNKTRSSVINV
jgi:hypothetical protein